MTSVRMSLLGVLLLAIAVIPTTPIHAQFNLSGATNDLTMNMSPLYPNPGDSVHLTVNSTLSDLSASTVTWRDNGKIVSTGEGVTSIDITAGALGTEDAINAEVVTPDGRDNSVDAIVAPTQIDILFDANSYVPPFYRGRALPSAGTALHVQALAYFKKSDGTLIPTNSIVYTWKQNGEVVGNVSGRGKSSATLPSPSLFGTDTITVDAVSADGSRAGESSIQVPSTEPVLVLYEDHPLFGIMYGEALGAQTSVRDSEMTFAAVPYFAQIVSPNDSRLVYAWHVNNQAIAVDKSDPSELTINADKSNGAAQTVLEVRHSSNFYMDSNSAWGISFLGTTGVGTATSGGGSFNPQGQ